MRPQQPTIRLRAVGARAAGPDCPESASLDADERARAATMSDASQRAQFVTRRAALRDELAARTGMPPSLIRLVRDPCVRCGSPHGRPRALGFDGFVSTSSTPSVAALAIADAPVGIDVEELASVEAALDVITLLHPAERAAIESSGDARRVFTQIWTRKEALLKATGEGLTAPLDRDDVSAPRTRPVPGWRIVDIPARDLERWGSSEPVLGAWALRDTP